MTTPRLTLFGRVISDGRELPPSRIEVVGEQIASIEADGGAGVDIDASDGLIIPGLIDLQINGAAGIDFTASDDPYRAVADVARVLARHGVTAFCPTIVSSPPETITGRLAAYAPRAHASGAESLGAHVEGPFIDAERRGIHDPGVLRLPTIAEVRTWLAMGRPAIVTLAPELDGALDVIRHLTEHDVLVSLGHSGADTATAQAGLAAGARMGTHVFNGMPPLHHRHPGIVGALLESAATLGVIADGVHLDPLVVSLVLRVAGARRVALVSDALAAAGAPPGAVHLGDRKLISDGRVVRAEDGTLAGAAVLLDTCLRNARAWAPWLSPAEVVRMATRTPAEALGPTVAARKGRVAPGYDADLVVLDADWCVRTVVVRGQVV